jgi:hypothetical protein
MPYVTEQNLTDVVLDRWKAIPDPRLRQVMQSFITHAHAFVRETDPTEAEWATAIGPDCDRQEMRRQAAGVYPVLRHHRRQHAGRCP